MTIQFPVYTFHFLYSSCGCSSKGLPASEKLPVSVSTTLKVTLQPTQYLAADLSADALCIINIGYYCYYKYFLPGGLVSAIYKTEVKSVQLGKSGTLKKDVGCAVIELWF